MLGILGSLFSSPMAILAMLAVFVGTSVFGEVKGWIRERNAIAPYAIAIKERDIVADVKDQITNEAVTARESALHEIARLQADLDAADVARKLAKVPDCVWSDDDVRMLNNAKRRPRR